VSIVQALPSSSYWLRTYFWARNGDLLAKLVK
jgi:hypothetical protein